MEATELEKWKGIYVRAFNLAQSTFAERHKNYVVHFLNGKEFDPKDFVFERFVRSGIDVNVPIEGTGETALMTAATFVQAIQIHSLIRVGANVFAQDNEGSTMIHYLVDTRVRNKPNKPSVYSALPKLITPEELRRLVNIPNNYGQTPLMKAVRTIFPRIKTLLDWGADKAATDKSGQTAVDIARHDMFPEAVALLRTAFNPVHQGRGRPVVPPTSRPDPPTTTPHPRRERLDPSIVKRIQDAIDNNRDPGDLSSFSKAQLNAFLRYAISKSPAASIRLIDSGANPNITDRNGKTVLMMMSWQPLSTFARESIFSTILDRGANVNLQDISGMTALMYAASKGNAAVSKILVEAGADLNMRNDRGKTALAIAVDAGYRDVEDYLLSKMGTPRPTPAPRPTPPRTIFQTAPPSRKCVIV
jgi:ankyrin repeat protein